MKKLLALLLIFAVFYGLNQHENARSMPEKTIPGQTARINDADSSITNAYKQQLSGIEVEGFGHVMKTLPDDHSGSRHQKFLLKLSSNQTILIAHNIDIAPRIERLQAGDVVYFKGVYEWNSKGGVVHWTHHDPQGRHDGGWLELNGRRFQ